MYARSNYKTSRFFTLITIIFSVFLSIFGLLTIVDSPSVNAGSQKTPTIAESHVIHLPIAFHNYIQSSWILLGPDALDVITFEINPLLPDVIYAGIRNGGLWYSQDGGQDWQLFDHGIPTTYSIRHIAVAAESPNVIYVSADDGHIYRSFDAGHNWEAINRPSTSYRIHSLTINPVTPTIVYAGTIAIHPPYNGPVMKSTNGGQTWEQTLPYLTVATHIVVDPQNPQAVFIASTQDGVLKSLDGGDNWQTMNNGLPENPSATRLQLDQYSSQVIFALVSGGLYKSENSGEDWTNISHHLPDYTIRDFALGTTNGVLFVAYSDPSSQECQSSIYRTHNHGETWQVVTSAQLCINKIVLNKQKPDYIFALFRHMPISYQIWQLTPINP
jgi:photosystem II stability/assembly factor-like uncharacterized protein